CFHGSCRRACVRNFGSRSCAQAMVEVRYMTTADFGHRVPAAQRSGFVLLSDAAAEYSAPVVDLASLSELKERIRTVLLSRIDPSVAGRIPRAALRREIAKLVSEIATEDRGPPNKLDETAFAA